MSAGEAQGKPKNRSRWRRLRWWHYVLALFGVAWVWFYWPVLNPRWDQDRCEFGAVSNAQYRDMLSELRPKARAVIDEIQDTGNREPKASNKSLVLTDYVREALEGKTTPDEKVAAQHAAMRALGAWHVRSRSNDYSMRIQYVYGIRIMKVEKSISQ